jgi:hypothetical protein
MKRNAEARKSNRRRTKLALPDLEHAKAAVLTACDLQNHNVPMPDWVKRTIDACATREDHFPQAEFSVLKL